MGGFEYLHQNHSFFASAVRQLRRSAARVFINSCFYVLRDWTFRQGEIICSDGKWKFWQHFCCNLVFNSYFGVRRQGCAAKTCMITLGPFCPAFLHKRKAEMVFNSSFNALKDWTFRQGGIAFVIIWPGKGGETITVGQRLLQGHNFLVSAVRELRKGKPKKIRQLPLLRLGGLNFPARWDCLRCGRTRNFGSTFVVICFAP